MDTPIMSTHCGNAKKMSFFVELLDVADVSSLNKTKNLQGRAEETFKSAIAFLLSSVMLNQVKCISALSNLHLSKVFSVRYLFCGVFFCVYAFKWPLLEFHRSITKKDIHKTGYFLKKYPREKRSMNLNCELRFCHEFWLAKQSFFISGWTAKKICKEKLLLLGWLIWSLEKNY